MHEYEFLNLIKSKLSQSSDFLGDDCAFVKEYGLVFTIDTLVEDVHFSLKTTSPEALGHKVLAVNLSDIAASGAIAKYALISLSFPQNTDKNFVEKFYEGLNSLAEKYQVLIIGGDLTRGEKISISITLIGETLGIKPSKRSFAKVGDIVVTTGFCGSSALGLWLLQNQDNIKLDYDEYILERFKNVHLKPEPRNGFGRIIAQTVNGEFAMMDTSDGLGDALFKIAQASNVCLEINKSLIPLSHNLVEICEKQNINPYEMAIFGGEDYELLACIKPSDLEKLQKNNIPLRKIGIVKASHNNGKVLIDDKELSEEILKEKSFRHFNI